jgi:hypothetical protein
MKANNVKLIKMFNNHKINIIIHLFEPNNASLKNRKKNNCKNIILNNYAFTNKIGKSTFDINDHTITSNFFNQQKIKI